MLDSLSTPRVAFTEPKPSAGDEGRCLLLSPSISCGRAGDFLVPALLPGQFQPRVMLHICETITHMWQTLYIQEQHFALPV